MLLLMWVMSLFYQLLLRSIIDWIIVIRSTTRIALLLYFMCYIIAAHYWIILRYQAWMIHIGRVTRLVWLDLVYKVLMCLWCILREIRRVATRGECWDEVRSLIYNRLLKVYLEHWELLLQWLWYLTILGLWRCRIISCLRGALRWSGVNVSSRGWCPY